MKRPVKIGLYLLGFVALLCLIGFMALASFMSGASIETSDEISLRDGYAESVRAAGFPITVTRAYSVSSYGGWHGDGETVSINKFPPVESAALLAALGQRYPAYTWQESEAGDSFIQYLRHLIPRDLLPKSETTKLVAGSSATDHAHGFVVDASDGLWYSFDSRF